MWLYIQLCHWTDPQIQRLREFCQEFIYSRDKRKLLMWCWIFITKLEALCMNLPRTSQGEAPRLGQTPCLKNSLYVSFHPCFTYLESIIGHSQPFDFILLWNIILFLICMSSCIIFSLFIALLYLFLFF